MKLTQQSAFKRDAKRIAKRGKDLAKLEAIVTLLISGEPLPPSCRDHALTGNWQGWRDCHIEPDWLLLYKRNDDQLLLGRTGTHADLF